MATPAVQFVPGQLLMQGGSSFKTTWQVNDLTGAPINLSSGWSARLTYQSQVDPVRGQSNQPGTTWTYGATGLLTYDLTEAQVKTIPAGVQNLYQVDLSNDGFTTQQTLAASLLQVNQSLT
jgi:hypothetical protein